MITFELNLKSMKIHPINAGNFKLDGGAMFGVVPKSIWHKLNPADSNNMCSWAMRCLLIEDGDRLILVDTGMGDKQSEKFFGYYYMFGDDSLEKGFKNLGFSFDDVTDVFLTHLHFDHCGGAIKNENGLLVPTFKNAHYWSHSKHWDWAMNPNPREKASFLKENISPIQESGQLKFIDKEPKFHPNIDVKLVHGHTESQMLPLIDLNGQKFLFCADLLASSAHLPLAFVMGYDVRPLLTLKEKDNVLNEAFENDYKLIFEHDLNIECATVKQTERGIRIEETGPLNSFN
ncbi:MAG: glyoxylase-like metal-dependent hydrolase (beta-lactamase superfamily II) [Sphingobacteriales bacterium]